MLPIHHVQVKKAKRVLAQAFVELPSKDEYPDYYELIKKPMDLRMILERIDEQQYRRWENCALVATISVCSVCSVCTAMRLLVSHRRC